jgi:hypothetical protein
MSTNRTEPWRTVPEAAAETGVPAWRIKRWAYSGRIPSSKPEGIHGRMFVRVSDVHAVMDATCRPATSGPLAGG